MAGNAPRPAAAKAATSPRAVTLARETGGNLRRNRSYHAQILREAGKNAGSDAAGITRNRRNEMSKFRKATGKETFDNWPICWTGQDDAGNHWNVTTDHVHASELSAYSLGPEGDAELIARLLDMHYSGEIERLQAERKRIAIAISAEAEDGTIPPDNLAECVEYLMISEHNPALEKIERLQAELAALQAEKGSAWYDALSMGAEIAELQAENAALKEMLRECDALNAAAPYDGGAWEFNSDIQKQIDSVLKGGAE
jgi:hypothetical protein